MLTVSPVLAFSASFDWFTRDSFIRRDGHFRHALPDAEVLITDPGRGNSAPFSRALAARGFVLTELRSRFHAADTMPFRSRLLSYRRGNVMTNGAPTRVC